MATEVTRLGIVLSPDWEPMSERQGGVVVERTTIPPATTTTVVTNRVRNIRVGNTPA